MAPSDDIHIEATETDPAVRARAAIHRGQRELLAELAAFTGPEPADGYGDSVHAELTGFCTGELRRHLAAADGTLYAAASGAVDTRLLVRALRGGLAALDARIDTVAATGDAAAAVPLARAVEAVLAVHLEVEETVLLPALATLPGADLPALVADMRTLLDGGRLDTPAVVDVREIPHGRRHPRIFARFGRLGPGEAFTLVNNHDPKPLRREFEAAHPGTHTWDYVESGPDIWRVRIGRVTADA
ncbi:DUF2249 domain-containing protein [Streptomyces sp. NBC_01754]|uniref:DUF2249 domain-containing protein n=1 Tax=Streptomyces sp. NBC_01754 TaxID=2975930 RepID=UPI002DDA8D76|nr:DUF2249 domain-containing protein [Streptomyces sp. NBC_01754]WSC93371.1 DUF2249 domain-containing protein [Streptomyces sp. NBC_01754]